MDLLLDTNVLIDHFGNRPGFAESSHKIMAMGLFGDATLWTTANSLIDAFYILSKAIDSQQVQNAFKKSILQNLHVCSTGSEDLLKALELEWPDLEDCLVSVCAEKIHAHYLVTRDEKGFSDSAIPTISPDELLKLMESKYGLCYDF